MQNPIHIAWFMSKDATLVAHPFSMLAAEYFSAKGFKSLVDVSDELWDELFALCFDPLVDIRIKDVGKLIPYSWLEEMDLETPIYARREDLKCYASA